MTDNGKIRVFTSGATRDTATNKLEYDGFLNPLVIERFAAYMHKNRVQSDGSLRASDNWQNGFPKDVLMHSAWRHFHDMWKEDRGIPTKAGAEEAICALLFNAQAYLLELLKERGYRGEG